MNNTTRRTTAPLVALAVLGLLAAIVLPHHKASTEVVTVDDTTTSAPGTTAPATTEVPETTTTVVTTTTVAPATTVVETTTVAPEPSTAPPTTAPALAAQEDAGIQPVAADPPVPAKRTGTTCMSDADTCNPPTTPPRTAWRYCEQWHELAAEVGWPESAGSTLSYVMHRESGCDPNAYNRSGATGLLQLLGHNCGGSCFDPENNLRTGLALYHGRGWCDWVLRGDPVTGHACG